MHLKICRFKDMGLQFYSIKQISLILCQFLQQYLSFIQEITIVDSMIETMDKDAFCGIENIHQLYMVNCGITLAPNVAPLQLSLTTLTLNNNRIKSFPANYFDGLRIRVLRVKNNLLTSVPPISGLALSIYELSLSRNVISSMAGLLINTTFHRLQTIDLSRNIISSAVVKISAPRLDWLNLRKNNISSIDGPESLHVNVDLRENPLRCNAVIAWVSQTGLVHPETRCASPACAAGRALSDLGRQSD